jgi:RNA polymerase sigma factor, sigma-70 family
MSLFKHNKEQYILSLFSKGDTLAMDKLYAEYADYMASVCTRYLGYTDDVHDVLQEAFIRVFTRIDLFVYKGEGSLKAWLTKIVVNEALRFLRDHNTNTSAIEDNDIPDEVDEEPDIDSLSLTQITDSILKLPPGYRAVFNLFVIEGKSHNEISKLLNIKPDTSASQLHKAKQLLARMLKEQNNSENDRKERMAQ